MSTDYIRQKMGAAVNPILEDYTFYSEDIKK